jgi:glyoxylate carboligase
VEQVFGIPGVHTVELYRGLARSSINHVTPRHEQGAGFMADGYARTSGKPGVCFIITGPGMTNITTAMGQAYADSIPMLVISSVQSRSQLGGGRGKLHELPNQSALVAGVAAFSHTLMSAAELPACWPGPLRCSRPGVRARCTSRFRWMCWWKTPTNCSPASRSISTAPGLHRCRTRMSELLAGASVR